MFQILAEPLVLAFSNAETLGVTETVCASGMLVTGVIIGIRGIKKYYVRLLGISLVIAGVAMFGAISSIRHIYPSIKLYEENRKMATISEKYYDI